jgi:hypothetical protein
MQGNWNFAEAEKCYRKALEVDPEDQTARADLAILLEHNANGWRYAKDARLGEAIETYREAIKKNPLPLFQQNLTIALLRAGQLDAAKEESKKCSPELQSGLLAMISAIQDGPAKVVVGAQGAFPDPRQRAQYLAGVAFTLVQLRQYAAAQVVMSAAARLAVSQEFQTRAEGFSKLKRWEDALVAEDDPRWPVQRFLMEAFRGNFTLEMVKSVMSKRADFSTWDHGMVSVQNTLAAARHAISSQGMEEETLVDLVLSMASFEQDGMSVHGEAKTVSKPGSREMTTVTFANEGEKYGYRIKMSMPGGSSSQTMYVIREDGKYKLLGSPPDGLELIGELALELLEKGDTRGAQWWLDKVVANIEPRSDGTGMPAVHALWSGVTPESRGPAAIRLASASLIGAGTGNAKAVQTLQEARAKAELSR